MKIFFENYADNLCVETDFPLVGSLEQAIDIFHNLPDYDGSFIGFVNDDGNTVQISKYDRFLFLVEIPVYDQGASYSKLLNYFQVKNLIEHLYNGFDPYDIPDLKFEQYITEKATK
ncbi:hypothetical protein [Faecalibacter bovis]|uniref:Uncharacterized protein n=1 Tax=Faecalibacter bovis TaxID=2898187 RepID=A0ABX7XBJ9_9FLAO|nr:hypothetical protein [Faecalibacter bovis]QTV05235.1 hypothetical protein J9309_10675 [Faecalibacter bovis]